MTIPRAVKREERDHHVECMKALRSGLNLDCSMCVVSKCSICVVSDGWRKFYQKVKLEWSMCLAPESWQDSYDTLMIDYQKMFAGEYVEYALLNKKSNVLLGWIRHTNESVIEYNIMHVEKREWHFKMIINGHMVIFGDINGVRSLEHLEAKVAQIPGVIRTRVEKKKNRNGMRPCLTIFVSLNILQQSHREMVVLITNHVIAENAGFSLVGRCRVDRYDYVEIDESPVASSLKFDVTRYDSLDLSESTAFQRLRRRRKYKEHKSPDTSTIRGRLRIVFQNRAVFKHWIKTGEPPDVHA